MSNSRRSRKERRGNGSADGYAHSHTHDEPEESFEDLFRQYIYNRHKAEQEQRERDRDRVIPKDISTLEMIFYGMLILIAAWYGLPIVYKILFFIGKLFWRICLTPIFWVFGYRHQPDMSTRDVPVPPIPHVANTWRLQECFVSYEHNYCGTRFEAPVVAKHCGELWECMDKEMARVGLELAPPKRGKARKAEGERLEFTEEGQQTSEKTGKKSQIYMGTVRSEGR